MLCPRFLVGLEYNEWLVFTPFLKPTSSSYLDIKDGFSIDTSFSNHFSDKSDSAGSGLLLDYEKYSVRLAYLYSFNNKLRLLTEVPFHIYSTGYFDAQISDWHQYWGFYNSGRELRKHNSFQYYLYSGDNVFVNENKPAKGIGDIQFSLMRSFSYSQFNVSPLLILSLPTGDSSRLLGLGYFSYAAGFHINSSYRFGTWYSQIFLMDSQLPDMYKGLKTTTPFQVDFGFDLPVLKFNTIHILSLYHSPLTDIGVNEIDGAALLYYLGIYLKKTESGSVLVSLQEDFTAASAPDFTLRLSVSI